MTHVEEITARLNERVGQSIVEEVRQIRQQLDELSEHDIHALAENARRVADEFRKSRANTKKRTSE